MLDYAKSYRQSFSRFTLIWKLKFCLTTILDSNPHLYCNLVYSSNLTTAILCCNDPSQPWLVNQPYSDRRCCYYHTLYNYYFLPVLHSRTPRLRASEFSATDNKHTQILLSMGVELHYTTDGRLQLTHAPNKVCMCTPSLYAPNKVCMCISSLLYTLLWIYIQVFVLPLCL